MRSCRLMLELDPTEDRELRAKRLASEVLQDINDYLLFVPRADGEAVAEWNDILLKEMKSLPFVARTPTRKPSLSQKEIAKLYTRVAEHPVAALSHVEKYDKRDYGIGFCFGRAMAGHLEALILGLDKKQIRKVWAVGELRSPIDNSTWRYHVTTVVRGNDGSWYAIDPVMGMPLKLEDWYRAMKPQDSNGKMALFTTEASRRDPLANKNYSNTWIRDEYFDTYFLDLLEETRSQAKRVAESRKSLAKNRFRALIRGLSQPKPAD